MATISLTLLKSRKNADGTFSVRVSVSHRNETKYIVTPIAIDSPEQWRCGMVVRRADAKLLNAQLRNIMDVYQQRLSRLPPTSITCEQLKSYLTSSSAVAFSSTIEAFCRDYIAELVKDNKRGSADNMRLAVSNLVASLGGDNVFDIITPRTIKKLDHDMRLSGLADTTIHIRMSRIRTLVNRAIEYQIVRYDTHPFAYYSLPECNVRDTALSLEEFHRFRDMPLKDYRTAVAHDLFLLSFYLGGINLVDMINARYKGDTLTYVRAKTQHHRTPNKEVSLTITPEAREIIDKYVDGSGRLFFRYDFATYEGFRTYITRQLRNIGKTLDFERPLMFYSARKTFCQFGFELGVPLYILEYAIGHRIKDAHNRPIFSYIKIMRPQADDAVRKIIQYTQ